MECNDKKFESPSFYRFRRRGPEQIRVFYNSQLPEQNNLHKSLRSVFLVAQIFGCFPVLGVLSEKPEALGFSWISVRCVSSLMTFTTGVCIVLCHIRRMIAIEYGHFEMNVVTFYTCGFLTSLLFIKLASEWRSIMVKWQETDTKMSSYGWPKNLNRQLKVISAVFLLLAALEHISLQSNKLIIATRCKSSFSKGVEHFFVNMSFPGIFDLIKPFYAPWLGIFLQVNNTRMAFSWTFSDLFIILVGYVLAVRFGQINGRIRRMRNAKVKLENSWSSVREDYNRLCNLSVMLDDKLSYIILLSFFTNIYFIIFQIYETLYLDNVNTLYSFYYCVSLSLLTLRMTSICLCGSCLREESKRSLDLLLYESEGIYNKEIVRLVESIKYQNVGLTGRRFFTIDKPLILKIATAIVTYELVIIQFRKTMRMPEKTTINTMC